MARTRKPCGVEECDRVAEWLGYCGKHAWRFKKYGDPLRVTVIRTPQGTCTVEDCETQARSRGMCVKHLTRWTNHGDVHHNARSQQGTANITYGGAHLRVRRVRGRARDQVCIDCGRSAHHWSYNHTDPDERADPKTGLAYSADPTHYSPRCTPCHSAFDHEQGQSAQVIGAD